MLKSRLLVGTCAILAVVFVSFADMYLSDQLTPFGGVTRIPRGIILFPLYAVVLGFLCYELLGLLYAGGIKPRRMTVYLGNYGVVAVCWFACMWQQWQLSVLTDADTTTSHGWEWAAIASVCTLVACALGMIFAFFVEIMRFKGPGGNTINLAGAVFAVAYLGMLSTFLIQLRVAFGVAALFSLIIVAKMGDVGAYFIGRQFGRHKMSPGVSPGKTIEGLIGGLAFGCVGSLLWFKLALPLAASQTWLIGPDTSRTSLAGCILFGLLVSLGGVVGDLGESLLKRDAQQKDSGYVPGFGGFLDIFDSLLIAAPIAYACWVFQIVAPGHH